MGLFSRNEKPTAFFRATITAFLLLVLMLIGVACSRLLPSNGYGPWSNVPPTVATYIAWMNTPAPNLGDGGLISQQPCGPPCFQGIYAGITTEQDARIIMQKLSEPCTDWDNTRMGGYRGIDCHNVIMTFANQTARLISFYPNSNINVAQLIEKYGSPDRMIVFISSILPDEPSRSNVRLFYDRFQIILDLTEQDGTEFTINKDTLVKNIGYKTKDGYQEYLALVINDVIAWQGYGVFTAKPFK